LSDLAEGRCSTAPVVVVMAGACALSMVWLQLIDFVGLAVFLLVICVFDASGQDPGSAPVRLQENGSFS